MPRPRRSRPAPAQAADTASAETEVVPERGRARTSGHVVEKETQEAPRRTTRRGRKQSVEVESRLDSAAQDALRKASDARDDAMKRLALEDVLTTSDAATSEANKIDLSVEMGRKVQSTPAQQRRDTTGLELDDDMFAGLDDSLDLGDDTDLNAPPSGQRSTDTSSMTTGFFKRRGRAPSVSLVGNDATAIRPSSRAGGTPAISSSFNIGAFRRRQREPSILGTGRKPLRAESPGEGAGPEVSDDEDVFAPEAESTPLNRRKTRGVEVEVEIEAEAEVEAPSSRRSRKGKGVEVVDAELVVEAPSSTKSRKRKSIEVPEGSDRPEKVSRLEASDPEAEAETEPETEAQVEALVDLEPQAEAEIATQAGVEAPVEEADTQPELPFEEDLGSDMDIPADAPSLHSDDLMPDDPANDSDSSDLSSLPSLPSPQLPSMRAPARPMTPINLSEVMAPPQSSGSEEDDIWPDLRAAVKRKRHGPVTPLRDGNISDMSSPPSLTHSPNLPATRHTTQKKQKGKPSPKLTTASLTGLLPRRRHRTRTTEDGSSDAEVDGSGLANDEDELSYIDTRPSRRRGKTTPLARRTATNRPGSRGGKAATKTTPLAARTVKRTYSRRSSDKENPSDDEDSTGLSPAPDDTFDAAGEEEDSESVAEELKNAVKKFAEVDQWEMEFEEMTQSSSPSGAR
ncbi:hypothetical protein F5X68DRAFT_275780 [Plectosphaerella plurivora]|uniref:Uncharacterized protein n=1 Tax=Plectosphaerella plurivora TaxID=936078 RepID=A0A9P9AAC4_9PEZI|nr:hypothetical protein F5X68DRAFT_275780 [Plectosphaerella plurivora]